MVQKAFLFLLLLVLAAAGPAFNGSAELAFFKAEAQNGAVVLSWQTKAETEVQRFELWRKTFYSTSHVQLDQAFDAHGPGKPYRYVDDEVYKADSELVNYELRVVYKDGSRATLNAIDFNYTTTAVRRTWGSIKAMFQ